MLHIVICLSFFLCCSDFQIKVLQVVYSSSIIYSYLFIFLLFIIIIIIYLFFIYFICEVVCSR